MLEANREEYRGDDTFLRKIQLFRTLRPYQKAVDAGIDPVAPVRDLIFAGLECTLSDESLLPLIAPHARLTDRARANIAGDLQALAKIRLEITQQTGLPPAVVTDIAMGSLRIKAQPKTFRGLAEVDVQLLSSTSHYFLVEEDQHYRIVATADESAPIGEEALYLASQSNLEQAAELLNWKREFSRTSPDDPLGGVLFAHLWSSGQNPKLESIHIAAASLMIESASASTLLPELIAAREKASGNRQASLTLLIASIALAQKDPLRANTEAKTLLDQYPDSLTAIHLSSQAFRLSQNWVGWQAMLTARLAAKPHDPGLLRERAAEQLAHADYTEARQTYQTLLDGGQTTAADENQYAWINLFTKDVDPNATKAAEAASGGKTPDAAALHTLACLYAVQGRAAEARDTLSRAVAAAHRVGPDDGVWLCLGLLYEQYGEDQAAITAFDRVTASQNAPQRDDPYALAQLHRNNLARLSEPNDSLPTLSDKHPIDPNRHSFE